MTVFFSVVGLALLALFLVVLLRQSGLPMLAVLLSLAAGVLILLRLLPNLTEALAVFRRLALQSGLNEMYLGILLKVLAVSYVAEFAAALCRDGGEAALSSKVELAGKVAIIVLAVPIIANILDCVVSILP